MNLRTKESDIIAKEGYPFISGGIASSLLFYKFGLKSLAIAGALFGGFSLYFFRNPKRQPPILKNALISPADGKIVFIGDAYERYFFKKETKRISVFMSLFDVHINRAPADGVVLDSIYNKGKFLPANVDKASTDNEQNAYFIETACGKRIVVVQIAGLVARRIAVYKEPNDKLKRGEIIGLIRFGSRVDVYIEDEFEEVVYLSEKVRAGKTVLGLFK
ncbi:phosphatidylserine decarboxylase family protein [Hippea maritima]|uniref:Phosphatidylserine decarboxylase proenzyme n=1 Tax=Hippea maritima (strain ATCC 700847 / DSM 10411 / MH2) TaxID=760142 RepID=F2LV96_HIPMA|nr:phosphatidylserine decarboxylase family protein [Hippea maritima]AEA33680.1 Phosphatidylserine decarboxylase proenzyme [Hippea maritima DSM 10411]